MGQHIDRRSEPDFRAVAEDEAISRGGNLLWLGRLADANANANAAYANAADADAAADAADAADAAAAADADADADANADADATATADAADAEFLNAVNRFYRGDEMREGLLLVTMPGRYWNVTRVGWARRVAGDEWELRGAVTITRTGPPVSLDEMASGGLPKQHVATKPSAAPELLHRLTVRRVLVANVEAWAKHCPKPKGWDS